MTRLVGPYPFMFDGEPIIRAFSRDDGRCVVSIIDAGDDGFGSEVSISVEHQHADRVSKAIAAFNRVMNEDLESDK